MSFSDKSQTVLLRICASMANANRLYVAGEFALWLTCQKQQKFNVCVLTIAFFAVYIYKHLSLILEIMSFLLCLKYFFSLVKNYINKLDGGVIMLNAFPFTTFGTWHTLALLIINIAVIRIYKGCLISTWPTVQGACFKKLSTFIGQLSPPLYLHT